MNTVIPKSYQQTLSKIARWLVVIIVLSLAFVLIPKPQESVQGQPLKENREHASPLGYIAEVTNAPQLRPHATWVVTSTTDSGIGSLRQSLLSANSGDAITFDPAVFPPTSPNTITLLSSLPALTQGGLTLDASSTGVVVDGRYTPPATIGQLQR